MIARLTVPHLDANLVDVTVTAWRKAPGDHVQPGEIVAELTTDKATFEFESGAVGTLLAILAAEKSVVPVGYILALVGEPGESDPAAAAHNTALLARCRETAAAGSDCGKAPAVPLQPASRVRATPRARRLAQEQGIDLARVQAATGVETVDEAALRKFLQGAASGCAD